jgi:phosphoserine phosphatase
VSSPPSTDLASPPLCVDLDGTLIAGDTLYISLARLARERPWAMFSLPAALAGGRARFKRRVSDFVLVDPTVLPYRRTVLDFLAEERGRGRRLILTTAADERIARAVAAHLALFDGIVASDGTHNAKGAGKVEAIRAFLGQSEFDYMGDHMVDLPVLRAARRGYLVAPNATLLAEARATCQIERVFTDA